MTSITINSAWAIADSRVKCRPEQARSVSRTARIAAKPNRPAASDTTKWMTISSRPANNPIDSRPTISGGCSSAGIAVVASANPAAYSATARSFARTIAPCAIGSGPRIEESRGSSERPPRP